MLFSRERAATAQMETGCRELAFHLSGNLLPVKHRRVELGPVRVNEREERLCEECFVPGEWRVALLGQNALVW